MKLYSTIFVFIALSIQAFCQSAEILSVKGHDDCTTALKIIPIDTIGPTSAPLGYGHVLEFKNNPKFSTQYIENEHHVAWYKFTVPYSALLAFDIIPLRIEDDYDFMLFRAQGDSNDCPDIIRKNIRPVRAIISRNDKSIDSRTGISTGNSTNFVHQGPGSSYGDGIQCDSGQQFYLLVDNVYENGKGHYIVFHYYNTILIRGDVRDRKTKLPLNSTISVTNSIITNDTLEFKTFGNSGFFKKKLIKPIDSSALFNMHVHTPGYFYIDTSYTLEQIIANQGKNLKFEMNKIVEGERIRLKNIHFYGNEARAIPTSIPTFEKLYQLMKENPGLKIRLEGHTNGCRGGLRYSINLSYARTQTIKRYLVDKGIDASRIMCKGLACSKMLYPEPKNDEEGQLNRRVEIYIVRYNSDL